MGVGGVPVAQGTSSDGSRVKIYFNSQKTQHLEALVCNKNYGRGVMTQYKSINHNGLQEW